MADLEKIILADIFGGAFDKCNSVIDVVNNANNGADQLVKLDSNGKLPAVDGSMLTNLPSGSGVSYILPAATTSTLGGVKAGNGVTIAGDGKLNVTSVCSVFLNVKDYGAKGDGATDDTAAIQTAINNLASSTYNKLYFPGGTYKITAPITIPFMDLKTIEGDNAMLLQYTDNVAILKTLKEDTWGILIEGMFFKYVNSQTKSGAVGLMFDCDKSTPNGFYQWTLHNCWFENCYVGIAPNFRQSGWTVAVWDFTLDNVTFKCIKHKVLSLVCNIGIPNICLRDLKVFNGSIVPDDTCLEFCAAGVVIESADIEEWKNRVLSTSGGGSISMTNFHIEHHILDGTNSEMFSLYNSGTFEFRNGRIHIVNNTIKGWYGYLFDVHGDGSFLNVENMIYSEDNTNSNPRPVWIGAFNISKVKLSNLDNSVIQNFTGWDGTDNKIVFLDNNFMSGIKINSQNMFYAIATPTTGTWNKGDRVFNSSPAVGKPKSWVCTISGTPGTWVSEGNL